MQRETFEQHIIDEFGIGTAFPPVVREVGNLWVAATLINASGGMRTWENAALVANTDPGNARIFRLGGKAGTYSLRAFHDVGYRPRTVEIDIDPQVLRILADTATQAMLDGSQELQVSGETGQLNSPEPMLIVNGVSFPYPPATEVIL